jgi:hypothetical protein
MNAIQQEIERFIITSKILYCGPSLQKLTCNEFGHDELSIGGARQIFYTAGGASIVMRSGERVTFEIVQQEGERGSILNISAVSFQWVTTAVAADREYTGIDLG